MQRDPGAAIPGLHADLATERLGVFFVVEAESGGIQSGEIDTALYTGRRAQAHLQIGGVIGNHLAHGRYLYVATRRRSVVASLGPVTDPDSATATVADRVPVFGGNYAAATGGH